MFYPDEIGLVPSLELPSFERGLRRSCLTRLSCESRGGKG